MQDKMRHIGSAFLFVMITGLVGCDKPGPMFTLVDESGSGIHFNNQVIESPELNILQYEYMYNGGGVGTGDFNNDGLPDIYFTGNRVANKLYLNRGEMKFEDVTAASKTGGSGQWSKGVSVIDINNDGWLDIYVCTAVLKPADKRRNLLYVNQGNTGPDSIPVFTEMAAEYGLADTSSTQMAAFFDYDNDGDLDVYLLVNELDESYPNQFRPVKKDGSSATTDRLFNNSYNPGLGHAVFSDVSAETGITWEGHGLGLHIADINNDGWKDIYVGNDYISSNLLYINDHGKFTNRCDEYFKHSSRNAMGNDIADLNNDGLQDLAELDMMPEDNNRQKMMNNPTDYQTFINSDQFGYMHQYARNTLQLNQGPRILSNDSIGEPVFSEIAFYSGVAQTDWSWSVLAVDLDNDASRDLLITNGLPKDLTDLDFMAYRKNARPNTRLADLLKELPTALVSNYVYRNTGDLTFEDKTIDWGMDFNSASAGMAYADFDLDGDLDVVINNTNMPASLLRNNMTADTSHHFLRVKLQGDSLNRNAIGSIIRIYYKGNQQVYECTPYRGYLSSVENIAHFGLGTAGIIDSLVIQWPAGQVQVLNNVKADETLAVSIANATVETRGSSRSTTTSSWFTEISGSAGLDFLHQEDDEIDFNVQRLLPRKLSQSGPALAAGDLNGDGLDDFIVGGGTGHPPVMFLQTADGFIRREMPAPAGQWVYQMGICLFDADGDNDLDMYITAGGNKSTIRNMQYADQLYINDGGGAFRPEPAEIAPGLTSRSCVKAADFDGDGDLDLFVGGRVMPGKYPNPVSSFIYRNDSRNAVVKFTDVTSQVAPMLTNLGLVTDALWTDIDNDGSTDLLITGEWMSPVVLKNTGGKFTLIKTDEEHMSGWWNSITGGDIDNDGDMDYVLGNFGKNAFLKATPDEPLRMYARDFDNNSSLDAIMSCYLPTRPHGGRKEFPVAGRDMMIDQIARMRTKYSLYKTYAAADMEDVLVPEDRETALQLSAENLSTGWMENKGGFKFVFHELPWQAQLSTVYGIVADDFDNDGNIDLMLNGNDFSMSPMLGRNDAMNGLLLKGNGGGLFTPLSIAASGIYIPGNGKAASGLLFRGSRAIAVSQNRGKIKLFRSRVNSTSQLLLPDDSYALIQGSDGHIRKQEFYWGSSFLSQSSRVLSVPSGVRSVTIVNTRGIKRIIK